VIGDEFAIGLIVDRIAAQQHVSLLRTREISRST
jgi:hypothetical protein